MFQRIQHPGQLFGIPHGRPEWMDYPMEGPWRELQDERACRHRHHLCMLWEHGTTLHDAIRIWRGRPKRRLRWRTGKHRSLDGFYLAPIDNAEHHAFNAAVAQGYRPIAHNPYELVRLASVKPKQTPLPNIPTLLVLRLAPNVQFAMDEDTVFSIHEDYFIGLAGSAEEKEAEEQGDPFVAFPTQATLDEFKQVHFACERARMDDPKCERRLDIWTRHNTWLATEGYAGFNIRVLSPFRLELERWEAAGEMILLYGTVHG